MKKWISILLGLVILISATVVIYAAAVQGSTAGSYHVYYDGGADGVTGLPSDGGDYTTGSTVTVKSGVPLRVGYEFLGWIASTGDDTYEEGNEFAITDSDVVFYARWRSLFVTLTYVFNNEMHGTIDYSVNDSQSYTYTLGSTQSIKELEAVFPDYTGYCGFMGWSTQPNTTANYFAGNTIDLTSDTTLYGVWKSCEPIINEIVEDDTTVTGSGVSGSNILVTFPDGTTVTATVYSNGTWLVNVPSNVYFEADDIVIAVQAETGKAVSDSASITVTGIDNPTVEPGIDMIIENLTTGEDYAKAGDTLLYDAMVSNTGTATWQSAYVTFYLNESVTLQVSSIRINYRTVTSSQYSYDSTANTLTLYLGDIAGGGGVNISFRVTVISGIYDIGNTVLNAELGSLVRGE